MTSSARADWLIPTLLITLLIIPLAAGAARLFWLASGVEITPENERFFTAPLPVVVHILSASVFCILGVFQFAPGYRRRRRGAHRIAGRILVPFGLVAALSGLWMTQFYPPVENDGTLLYVFRLLFGFAMALFIILGFAAIRRRDIARHRAWMMRGYAIAVGTGTQALIYIPWVIIVGMPDELSRALLFGAGWAISLAVAEWIVRKWPHPSIAPDTKPSRTAAARSAPPS